eukprot:761286-Hanusia_phi.AAC.4
MSHTDSQSAHAAFNDCQIRPGQALPSSESDPGGWHWQVASYTGNRLRVRPAAERPPRLSGPEYQPGSS